MTFTRAIVVEWPDWKLNCSALSSEDSKCNVFLKEIRGLRKKREKAVAGSEKNGTIDLSVVFQASVSPLLAS